MLRTMLHVLVLSALGSLLACGAAHAQNTFTYIDLVHQMKDLERVAVLPQLGERTVLASSYDRRSRYDAQTDTYIDWFANNDFGGAGYIRQEGNNYVLAEWTGPGCIQRMFSADQLMDARVQFYLDGEPKPVIDMTMRQLLSGREAPFNYPNLVYCKARGYASFVPVPFQKSCRIVSVGTPLKFYQFTCRLFPPGTKLPTFSRDLAPEDLAALKDIDDFFGAKLGTDPAAPPRREEVIAKQIEAPARTTQTVARIEGPAAITAIRVKLDPMSRHDQEIALRSLALQITWDDERAPAVWSPLGDFFGTAPGINLYRSLPLGMTEDGFYCFWYMPFQKSALVELVNDGAANRTVSFQITSARITRPIAEFGRFHAKWHRSKPLPAGYKLRCQDPAIGIPEHSLAYSYWYDRLMLLVTGRGRLCGISLNVWETRGGWWGEGDEKFFVDGEKFPSCFGTGTEDYFTYAWGNRTLFSAAYHNQPLAPTPIKPFGQTSVNRFQIVDAVPFQQSIEATLECSDYMLDAEPNFVVYWYLDPGGNDPYAPLPLDQRIGEKWGIPLP